MPATATAVKVCKKYVHNGTERVYCKEIYQGMTCPKQKTHLLDIKTGYCNTHNKIGQHEGEQPKSGGKPLPTCRFWQTCPCECHSRIDAMFKLANMPRTLMDNPEYVPDIIEFNIEDYIKPEVFDDFSDDLDAITRHGLEGTPDGSPVAAQRRPPITQRRTELGYASRGTLEAQVWEQCRIFADAKLPVTPKQIAELIADKYKIPTPSSGAIGAVLNRWEKLEFAEQGRKPVRFMRFCNKGTWEELEIMKGKLKREKRQTKSEMRRGMRR